MGDAREHGSKQGSGFLSKYLENVDRRERLRRLALETIDLEKDPYFMKNHLGQYECRLCLTFHSREGSYLTHTQGKKHQQNLAKRASKILLENKTPSYSSHDHYTKNVIKVGRPGYRVTKQFNEATNQRSILFQVNYREIEKGYHPRHRFMTSYEQRQEPVNGNYQYIIFYAEPYDSIGFKVPSYQLDCKPTPKDCDLHPASTAESKTLGKWHFVNWDPDLKVYTLQIAFCNPNASNPDKQISCKSLPLF